MIENNHAIEKDAILTPFTEKERVLLRSFLESVAGLTEAMFESGLTIEAGQDELGQRFLSLQHSKFHDGNEIHFEYHVYPSNELSNSGIQSEGSKIFGAITLPEDFSSQAAVEKVYASWKQLTVADPLFYARYSIKGIVPEKYQERFAVELVKALFEDKAALCHMATGTGKTVVNMLVWNLYSKLFSTMYPGVEKGKHLFIVDRNIILGEASEKIIDMYGDKYKIGKIYDAQEDFDADVIFATPSSLASQGRLKRLCESGKISLVTFDETHHLPAAELSQVYSGLEDANRKNNWGMAYLGLSATIIRNDERSVIRYFNRDVTVTYDKLRGYRDGNLVSIKYIPADLRLDKSVDRYDKRQFPVLYETYRQAREAAFDRRSLFICPLIDKADDLANFFNEQSLKEGTGKIAIALHSGLQMKDKKYFDHVYYAWKYQQWPENSPWEHEQIPEVVMAVDMLGEGIDVPGIANIFLWEKIGNLLTFIQTIGRGIRVAPFKPFLSLYDVGGSYHNKDIMQHLHNVGEMINWSEVSDDRAIALDSETFEDYSLIEHDDLPEYLAYVFGNYDSIPRSMLERLDGFMADSLGSDSIECFYNRISEIGNILQSDNSSEQIASLRNELIQIYNTTWVDETTQEVLQSGSTLIVFLRLSELIAEDIFNNADQRAYILFPEFGPEYEEMLILRARNLKYLRTAAFGLTTKEMSGEFYRTLVQGKIIDASHTAWMEVIAMDPELSHPKDDTLIDFAERKPEKAKSGKAATVASSSKRRTTRGGKTWQESTIASYMAHPRIAGKLSKSDFCLAHDDFKEHLKANHLFSTDKALMNYIFTALKKRLAEIKTCSNETDNESLLKVLRQVQYLFEDNVNLGVDFWKTLTQTQAKQLLAALKEFEELQNSDSKEIQSSARAVVDAIKKSLSLSGVRLSSPSNTVSDLEFTAYKVKSDMYELQFSAVDSTQRRASIPCFSFEVRSDCFGRPIFIVEPTEGITHFKQGIKSLPAEAREETVRLFLKLINNVALHYHSDYMLMLPFVEEDEEAFLNMLVAHLKEEGVSYLCDLDRITKKRTKDSIAINAEGLKKSYLNFADDRYIEYLLRVSAPKKAGDTLLGFHQNINELVFAYHDFHTFFIPEFENWKKRIRAIADQELSQAAAFLTAVVDHRFSALCHKVIPYFSNRKRIFSIFENTKLNEDNAFEHVSVLIIALREIVALQSQRNMSQLRELVPEVDREVLQAVGCLSREFLSLKFYVGENVHLLDEDFLSDFKNYSSRVLESLLSNDYMRSRELLDDVSRWTDKLSEMRDDASSKSNGVMFKGRPQQDELIVAENSQSMYLHRDDSCPALAFQEEIARYKAIEEVEREDGLVCCDVCEAHF